MVRLFRFRARRGVGVSYSLSALFILTIAVLIAESASPYLTVAVALAGWLAFWYVRELAGFRGLERMVSSLDFVDGGEDLVHERMRWYTNPNYMRLLPVIWACGYVVASLEGLSLLSGLFVLTWVAQVALVRVFILSRSHNSILEPRAEDWATVIGIGLILLSGLLTQNLLWGLLIAFPIFLGCGLKSLYDAPKELTRVSP